MFVSVTAWAALVVPTSRLAKASEVGERLTPGVVPVPLRPAV